VILGASGAIGRCGAADFKCAGYGIAVVSRGSEHSDRRTSDLHLSKFQRNATSAEEVEACFAEGIDSCGRIGDVANGVGSVVMNPAHMTTRSKWHETIGTALTSASATVRADAKTIRNGGGSVALMCSDAGRIGRTKPEAIATAKAGIIGWV